MEDLTSFFSDLTFDEKEHAYYVNGKRLSRSVSSFLKDFGHKFNEDKMSYLVAKKEGKTQHEIKTQWRKKASESCELGTRVHMFGEKYLADKTLTPSSPYEEALVKFWSKAPSYIVPAHLELKMYHKKYMFGGTADLVLFDEKNKGYYIYDYKTNQDLFKNYKGQTLLMPFQDLLDSPINKYQIQLSLYQILLEQATEYPVFKRALIWLKPDTNFEVYQCVDYTTKLKEYLRRNCPHEG